MAIDLLLRDVLRRGDTTPLDLAISGGRIVEAGPALTHESARVIHGQGALVIPGLVNAHLHLDKAGIPDELHPPAWDGTKRVLREANRVLRATDTHESVVQRGVAALEQAIVNGCTYVRGFADIERVAGLRGIGALVELRERYAGEVRVDVVAHPQDLLYGRADNTRLLEEAIDAGATVVGGMPSEEPTVELVHRHVDFVLALAKRSGLDAHFLLDDTDDPSHRALEYLAWRTIREGMEGRVIAGHCGALSSYDHAHAAMVVDRVAEAGIHVCVNAHISLTLQGRQDRAPVRRGTTRVKELLAAGVNLLAAQDDVNDHYYPLGRSDLLEVAHYTAHVCHLLWPEQLETVLDMVTTNAARAVGYADYGTHVGAVADLVVLGRSTVRAELADMPPRRAVISGGHVVAETTVDVRRALRAVAS
jgi:cytosine deaminase